MPSEPQVRTVFWTRRTDLWFAAFAAFLLALYIGVIFRDWYYFFYDDSYFYLQVAWNFAHGRGSTFNGILPTNGYHPLWMLVCAAVYTVVPGKREAIPYLVGLMMLLQLGTLAVVWRIVRRMAGGLWPLSFAVLVPFLFLPMLGTESSLSSLLLALLMAAALRFGEGPTWSRSFAFHLAAMLAVLARLDNIFVVALVWIAVARAATPTARRMLYAMLPVCLLPWCGYIASNWIWFHTLQPISGLLKTHREPDAIFGHMLYLRDRLRLLAILLGAAWMGWRRRDLFFRTVELPYALGVLCHAGSIAFFLSSDSSGETWYFTSWVVLLSVLIARCGQMFFARLPRLAVPAAIASLLLIAGGWWRASYARYRPPIDRFTQMRPLEATGIQRVLAYDGPGYLAYGSTLQVVPLDGLMGDMAFQRALERDGIATWAREHGIDGFVGPDQPIAPEDEKVTCERLILYSSRFHCGRDAKGQLFITSVDIYARATGTYAGTLQLPVDHIAATLPGGITLWRLDLTSPLLKGTPAPPPPRR